MTRQDIDAICYEWYQKEFPSSAANQSLEQMQQRGGFGDCEVIRYLACHIEELKKVPPKIRQMSAIEASYNNALSLIADQNKNIETLTNQLSLVTAERNALREKLKAKV